MSQHTAFAVTAAAITPDTPRHKLRNPGISVEEWKYEVVAWKSLATGWEISLADGTLDTEKADALLAEMGWQLVPDSELRETSDPGQYFAGVEQDGDDE